MSLEVLPSKPEQETQRQADVSTTSPSGSEEQSDSKAKEDGKEETIIKGVAETSTASQSGDAFVTTPLVNKQTNSTSALVIAQESTPPVNPTNQNISSAAADGTDPNESRHGTDDAQALRTLDAYEGPPILSESGHPDSTAAEQQRGLISTVTEISVESSETSKERLRFVAADLLEQDLEVETPLEIYNLVFDKYDSDVPTDENSPTTAATIFQEMLPCARFEDSHVQALDRFRKEGLEEESWNEKLNFRRNLLEIGDKISDEEALKKLVRKFTRRQIRGHRDDITTPIQLFRSLLNRRTISFETASESVRKLEDKWKEVSGSLHQSHSIQMSGGAATTNVGRERPPGGVPDKQYVKQKRYMIASTVIMCVLLTAVIAVCIGLIPHFNSLSTESFSQQITLYGNTTIFFSKEPLNILFTIGINFFLRTVSLSTVEICYMDCSRNSRPPTRLVLLDVPGTSSPIPQPHEIRSTPLRRHIPFSSSRNFRRTNIYLVGGSDFLFSTDPIGEPLYLYVFNDMDECAFFLRNITHSKSGLQIFELNEHNGYRANFTLPPNVHDSYYCSVWVVPSNQSNTTFQYSVKGNQIVYDTSTAQCKIPPQTTRCPGTSDSDFCYSYTLTFNASFVERYMCVLLSELNEFGEVDAAIQSFATLRNPVFISPFAVMGLIIVLMFVMIIVVIIIWRKCKQRCKSNYSVS